MLAAEPLSGRDGGFHTDMCRFSVARTAVASDWYEWGATLGGGEYVARSALGQDGAGDLLYAGSMSASPMDMARALAAKGARIGMELDINPEWVQLDVAPPTSTSGAGAVTSSPCSPASFLASWRAGVDSAVATS
jgi:hypothetical protein